MPANLAIMYNKKLRKIIWEERFYYHQPNIIPFL